MTHLYLIRHGDYINVENGKLVDRGLSPLGLRQAERLRDRLMTTSEIKMDVLISSTMLRARQTAAIIAPALGMPIMFDEEVEEWRNQDGTISPEEFNERFKAIPWEQRPFFRWAAGYENLMEFSLRIRTALHRIIHEHEGKTIVIVCHNGIVEVSFVFFFGLSVEQLRQAKVNVDHTAITHWYKTTPEGFPVWVLECYNDKHHLHESLTSSNLHVPFQTLLPLESTDHANIQVER
jgi:2,3-bisphosphoglycerate-dependent phosphoglycerate mutase